MQQDRPEDDQAGEREQEFELPERLRIVGVGQIVERADAADAEKLIAAGSS